MCEQMGRLAGNRVRWNTKEDQLAEVTAQSSDLDDSSWRPASSAAQHRAILKLKSAINDVKHYGGVVICHRHAAHGEARELQVPLVIRGHGCVAKRLDLLGVNTR